MWTQGDHILPEYMPGGVESCLCGAMLDIPKNPVRKIALNNNRSESQAIDMRYKI